MIRTDAVQRAILAARAADDKKAEDIIVLDLEGICTFTDAFVICSGSTSVQLAAIADAIRESLKGTGMLPGATDGARFSEWVVMDYGDFLVHIMSEESRKYYRLDDLWGDGKSVDWQAMAAARQA